MLFCKGLIKVLFYTESGGTLCFCASSCSGQKGCNAHIQPCAFMCEQLLTTDRDSTVQWLARCSSPRRPSPWASTRPRAASCSSRCASTTAANSGERGTRLEACTVLPEDFS